MKNSVFTNLIVTALMLIAHPATALEVNKSNLWYGDGEGIEIVFRTGENLAFTGDDPTGSPGMSSLGSIR